MTPGQESRAKIAIGGRYLDEVCIRQNRTDPANTVSSLSFPVHRHQASVEPDHLAVSTQAASVVQLFAEGALAPIGGPVVTVQIGDQQFPACQLETIETDSTSPSGTAITIRFRHEGTP